MGTSSDPLKLHISSGETEEKLQKKIGQVNLQQKEMDTMRFAQSIGYPHIDLEKFPVNQQALRQVPEEQAEALGAACFFLTQDEVRIGALDPRNTEVQELLYELQERNHANGAVYVISEKSFDRILRLYGTLPDIKPITKDIEIHLDDLKKVEADVGDFRSLRNPDARVHGYCYVCHGAGLKLNASDVHVEPRKRDCGAFSAGRHPS